MPNTRIVHAADIIPPIEALEGYFRDAGVTIIQATFTHSFFVDPDEVRRETPYYPNRARVSQEHFPGRSSGEQVVWAAGDGRLVTLDHNHYPQEAWVNYTGCEILRRSAYGLRHIWGNPWNPDAFTAGWNFCYMPYWAGMLTENQHPYEPLRDAIQQASWDLYFRHNPVCQPPDFVQNPGLDLRHILGDQPLLIMAP